MLSDGPIILIEDDIDDQEIFQDVLNELGILNELKIFPGGHAALQYLRAKSEMPFIIFCDINMPHLNGLEVRNQMEEDAELKHKCIPFVFFTTSASKDTVREAYSLNVQGFFTKPSSITEMKDLINEILIYWRKCNHPNN